jgi:hypothetical protein
MTVGVSPTGAIELQGECPSEDAEMLLQQLLANSAAAVDWSACTAAHTAVIQVLLVANPTMRGIPQCPALRQWILPLLDSRRA